MKVVILAGGEGKRLRPLTDRVPKNLVEINGRAIIDHQVEAFRRLGIKSFVILTGYKHEELEKHFSRGYDWADFSFSVEDKPLGTGGSIKAAEKHIGDGEFLVMNGDVMTDIDIPAMLKNNGGLIGKIALVQMYSPYGIVKTADDRVVGFEEKPLLKDLWLNAGVYWFSGNVFDYLPDEGSVENVTFPQLAKKGKLGFCKYDLATSYWRSIDTMKDYEEMDRLFKNARKG